MRRPGAAEEVELDLEILRNLAARASQRWKAAEHCDLNGLARDFATVLRAELDYLQEAGHAQEFAANFAADPQVRIPAIYPELTTSRVITLERIRGLKISDVTGLDATGEDRAALGRAAGHHGGADGLGRRLLPRGSATRELLCGAGRPHRHR